MIIEREMMERAMYMLSRSETLLLGLIEESGWPVIYPLERVTSERLEQVIFITKYESYKVGCIQKQNRCCIECHADQDTVLLQGKVDILTDWEQIAREEILPEAYRKRVMAHENYKDYCVLLFETKTAKLNIDGKRKEILFADK